MVVTVRPSVAKVRVWCVACCRGTGVGRVAVVRSSVRDVDLGKGVAVWMLDGGAAADGGVWVKAGSWAVLPL